MPATPTFNQPGGWPEQNVVLVPQEPAAPAGILSALPAARGESTPRPALDSRCRAAWVLLAGLLSFAALATPRFLGRVYVADDLGEFHLPVRNFYSQQLCRGEPFDWMPQLFGGFYLTGEGQLGAYHPLHWALYRWLPLATAFDLELLASYPLMFAGMYLFLRRWVVRPEAAMFGALSFTFGGFSLLHFVHPNAVAVAAHIPWLLFAIEVALTTDSRRRRATAELAVGLLTASQLLLGYPQYVWFSLLTVTAYAAWRTVRSRAPFSRPAALAVATVLGVLVAGVQLLPTADALAHSSRQTAGAEFANSGSLHPLNVLQLVAPYLFKSRVVGQNTHELGLYAGAVPCLLCVWLLSARGRWGRFAPLVWTAIVFGTLAFLLAMGEYGPLYRLQQFVPLANRFRFPCRAIVLVQLAIATGAAVALAIMLRQSHRDANSKRPLLVAVLASGAVALIGVFVWPEHVASWWLVALGPALVGTGAVLIAMIARGIPGSMAALAIFTALDLCAYGLTYSVLGRTADLNQYIAAIPLPPGDASLRITVPDSGDGIRSGDRMLLAGLSRIDGYAGLEPARELDYSTEPALRLAGVGWILHAPETSASRSRQWSAVAPTAPRARLIAPSLADSVTFEPIGSDENAVVVAVDQPGRIVVDVVTPSQQVLTTTESFHPGWRAIVDGQAQPAARVHRDFLGCELDAGSHRVEFVFRPVSLAAGKILSACGLGLIVCAFWLRWRSPRSETRGFPCPALP